MITPIAVPKEVLEAFCHRHGIRRLALYGSALREDFRSDSDLDVLVEFDPDLRISLLDLGEMQMELSELFGRFVDLKTPGWISRDFRDAVLRGAKTLYERT